MAGRARPRGRRHHPVVDENGRLIGIITRRDFLDPVHDEQTTAASLIRRPPAVIFPDNSLREAADHMVRENIGRLPVVERDDPRRVIGIITRSDLLRAHERRLAEG
ncbi:MAG TPA: CBS domain-containing protein [Thermoanaerobaculia bacterium]|nr:CBS domain-containing protein [Thermoanaerobaculia bacterium]